MEYIENTASQNAKFGISSVLLQPDSYLISEHIKHSSFCVGLGWWFSGTHLSRLNMSMLDLCVNFFQPNYLFYCTFTFQTAMNINSNLKTKKHLEKCLRKMF